MPAEHAAETLGDQRAASHPGCHGGGAAEKAAGAGRLGLAPRAGRRWRRIGVRRWRRIGVRRWRGDLPGARHRSAAPRAGRTKEAAAGGRRVGARLFQLALQLVDPLSCPSSPISWTITAWTRP